MNYTEQFEILRAQINEITSARVEHAIASLDLKLMANVYKYQFMLGYWADYVNDTWRTELFGTVSMTDLIDKEPYTKEKVLQVMLGQSYSMQWNGREVVRVYNDSKWNQPIGERKEIIPIGEEDWLMSRYDSESRIQRLGWYGISGTGIHIH